ncbi:MAG: CapA family protein [Cyanobacteria bacterium SBLK]|nr:CapA family protein [Cyanobacteria bacterium SBLK]
MISLKRDRFFIRIGKYTLFFLFVFCFSWGNSSAIAQVEIDLPLPEPPQPPPPQFIFPEAETIAIKAVGDTILGTNFPSNQLPANPASLFNNVQSLLMGADFLFGNFESTITTYPNSAKVPVSGRVYAFRSPPSHAKVLQQAGFHILSVANNHSHDFTQQGFRDTMRYIQAEGMQAVGAKGQIVYTEANRIKVAWIGFSYLGYHNSLNNLGQAAALVKQADANADIIIISVHAGAEGSNALHVRNQTETFYSENRGNMVRFSRAMIDNGADLILGHGPHVPRAIELYRERLVAYSLGNFIGYRTLSASGPKGYSLILEVQLDREGKLIQGNIIPLHLNGEAIPFPDPEKRTIALMQRLTRSDFPNTPIAIDANGNLIFKN